MEPRRPVNGSKQTSIRHWLNQDLREQKLHVLNNKEVLCDVNGRQLDEAVKRMGKALEMGEEMRAKEACVHADVFNKLADCGVTAITNKLQQAQGRGPLDWIKALRLRFVHTRDPQRDGAEDPTAFSWAEFGAAGGQLFRPAPGVFCMLGPLDAQRKERKAPAQRAKRQAAAELARPDEKEFIEEQNKQETDRNMEIMWHVLKAQGQPVRFPELICNHRSFAQTVENWFTLSFLLRDGRVIFLKDTKLGLLVRAAESKKGEQAAGRGGQQDSGARGQAVAKFTTDQWKVMCRLVKPEDALMPHRESLQPVHEHEETVAAPSGAGAAGASRPGARKAARHA